MNDLFKQITDLHARVTGWCPLDKMLVLASAVVFNRPAVICEIGVWGGKSLLPMALACQAIGHGKVIAIDPWSKEASLAGFNPEDTHDQQNINWWGAQDHEMVYISFLEHVRNLGLQDIVEVRRAKSDDVEAPGSLDLFHLDGSHTEQAIRDMDRFASKVESRGLVVTDDDEWSSQAPKIALDHLREMNFDKLFNLGTGSVWRRR